MLGGFERKVRSRRKVSREFCLKGPHRSYGTLIAFCLVISLLFVPHKPISTGSTYSQRRSAPNRSDKATRDRALSLDSVLPALNDVVPIPSALIGNASVDCASDNLFKTSYHDAIFAVCASGSSGFTATGLDLTLDVEYLQNPVSISVPKLTDGSPPCDSVAMPTKVAPTTRAILTGSSLPTATSRRLKASAPMAIEAKSCTCKSIPRPCVFLHGLGTSNERAELQDTPKLTQEKFGIIGDHAPCCTSVKYAVINTVDAGWRNDTLQQKFCDFSLSMSESSDVATGTIADTIVVTHSMGGLVMAAALAKGKCKFAESTSWVSLSAPMMGSMAGDFIRDLCDGEFTKIVAGVLDLIGQCPASTAKKSIIYQNEKYSTPEINAAYTAAQEAYRGNVTAAICSTSYHGVLSKFTPSVRVSAAGYWHFT
ncbi:hypothetical protein PHYSODRAFT_286949 [Phytophthora sojae]|uniref:Uncharacterized protein n=1 Tax=Phytophthora sojae (strain P6497) TaxID=1094619 RepID=G4ZVJ7_PHYSP|nr:hypothetical protein PHYSODRAFT_286949 [Phytophthora sojae]EGZ12236.1 hypothetical protein PHYSODRAFT_286949 [Phytophthora sojae]|eukprot:XP_009532569.1 hypothetical protein PHYSODRAFT_286949 [Phytophthora sojae]